MSPEKKGTNTTDLIRRKKARRKEISKVMTEVLGHDLRTPQPKPPLDDVERLRSRNAKRDTSPSKNNDNADNIPHNKKSQVCALDIVGSTFPHEEPDIEQPKGIEQEGCV